MKLASSCVVVVLGFAASLANAQPGEPPPTEGPPGAPMPPPAPVMQPPPPAVVVTAQPPGVDQGVIDDAMSPGAFLMPTALTEPAGTVTVSLAEAVDTSFNDSEAIHVSASYAITNTITLSGTMLLPSEANSLQIGMLSAKAQIIRANRLRVALHGAVLFGTATNAGSDEAGIVGGTATYCFDEACNSNASGYLGVGIFHDGGSGVPFLVSGSVTVQVAPHFKLVGEAVTGFSSSSVSGEDSGFIGFYGARLTHKNIGLNVGFVRPFGTDVSVSGFGELFASVTARLVP
jgi:hypothetical protein